MENKDSSNKENQPVAKETYDNIPDYDNLQGSDSSDEEILYRDDDDDSPGKTPFSFTYELDLFRLFNPSNAAAMLFKEQGRKDSSKPCHVGIH